MELRSCVLLAGAMTASAMAGLGCLPDPTIVVPDFSVSPSIDAGTTDLSSRPDGSGGGGDMGMMARWTTDGTMGVTDTLRAVWAADPALNQAYAVGQNGLILHRSGGTWQKEQAKDGAGKVITANLYAVAASSAAPDVIYAVGEAGMILRRAAGVWSQEGKELATSSSLLGLSVLDNSEVIVVGDGGTIGRRQMGGVYVAEDTTALASADLRAVAGTTADTLVAVGLNATIANRVGGKWQFDPFPISGADQGNYYAVSRGPDGIFVAGEYGRVLRRDVVSWVREATIAPLPPAFTHFYGLANTAKDELFAVGSGGVIQRRDGRTQAWSLEPSGVTVSLYGISGAGLGSAVTVGEQGTLLRRQ